MQIAIEPNTVYTFKLNSGEELIAKVIQSGGDFIIIEEPVSIAPTQQGMQMIPSVFTANPKGDLLHLLNVKSNCRWHAKTTALSGRRLT